MKRILLIGTGGTIASEQTESGLAPDLSTDAFLQYVPKVKDLCEVDCLQVCHIDSTNMTPAHWTLLAQTIAEKYDAYDGFVIAHGTDTMAYTATALSYLVQDARKPIVLTGGQKPVSVDITDAKTNLYDSFACAVDGRIGGVQIVFGGMVIAGTRARKIYTKRFAAFDSVNYPVLGVVQEGMVLPYICPNYKETPVFSTALHTKVALLKLIPTTDASLLTYLLSQNDAVIIESYGVGGVPDGNDGAFYKAVEQGVADGKTIIVTTQVPNEGSDLQVYRVGHQLKSELRVLEAYDMTTESVVAKTMWVLGQTRDPAQIRKLFYTPIACDILHPKSETTGATAP